MKQALNYDRRSNSSTFPEMDSLAKTIIVKEKGLLSGACTQATVSERLLRVLMVERRQNSTEQRSQAISEGGRALPLDCKGRRDQ